jgi:hypothetical protein
MDWHENAQPYPKINPKGEPALPPEESRPQEEREPSTPHSFLEDDIVSFPANGSWFFLVQSRIVSSEISFANALPFCKVLRDQSSFKFLALCLFSGSIERRSAGPSSGLGPLQESLAKVFYRYGGYEVLFISNLVRHGLTRIQSLGKSKDDQHEK